MRDLSGKFLNGRGFDYKVRHNLSWVWFFLCLFYLFIYLLTYLFILIVEKKELGRIFYTLLCRNLIFITFKVHNPTFLPCLSQVLPGVHSTFLV